MLKGFLRYFTIALLFFPLFCRAQQEELVRGIIFRKTMMEKLADVNITNLRTNITTKSNYYGEFITRAAIGDTLLIEKPSFTPIKQAVTSYSPLYITMLQNITLNEVTIKGQTKKQELNDIVKDYRSKGIYYDGKPPIGAYLPFGGSPITVLHELFGKDAKNERRFMKYAKQENEATEVSRRYTPDLVAKTTGLTGIDVQHFMENYTPQHDDLVKWNDYQLIQYIKKSYESFKKVGYQKPVDIFKTNP